MLPSESCDNESGQKIGNEEDTTEQIGALDYFLGVIKGQPTEASRTRPVGPKVIEWKLACRSIGAEGLSNRKDQTREH